MPPFPTMTFDLDLWPTDLKINRDHLHIKDYLPTKFEASGVKRSWVISCTRLRDTDIPTDIPTYRPTCAKQHAPPFSKGGIKKIADKRIPSYFIISSYFKWNIHILFSLIVVYRTAVWPRERDQLMAVATQIRSSIYGYCWTLNFECY